MKCNCTKQPCVFPEELRWLVIFIYHVDCAHCSPPHYTVCQGQHVHKFLYLAERKKGFSVQFSVFPFEMQPIITLEGSISHTFQKEGKNKVTVQVASGSTVMQDSKAITVKGEWQRQSTIHLNWSDTRCINMQYAVSSKV